MISTTVTLLVTHNTCAKDVRSVGLQVEPRLHSNGRAAAFPGLAVPTGIIPDVARRSCAEEGMRVRLQYTPVSAIESVTRRRTLMTSSTLTLLVTHSTCAQDVRSGGLRVEPTLHSNDRAAVFFRLSVHTGIIPKVARHSCAKEGWRVRLRYAPVSAIESVTRRKTRMTSTTVTLFVTRCTCAQDV